MPRSKGWRDPEERPRPRPHEAEDPGAIRATKLGDVLDRVLAERPFAGGLPLGSLARSWPEVVGERIASETAPAALRAGTLVVHATSGPWAAQARFLAEEIRRRANEMLGTAAIERVQIVVVDGSR